MQYVCACCSVFAEKEPLIIGSRNNPRIQPQVIPSASLKTHTHTHTHTYTHTHTHARAHSYKGSSQQPAHTTREDSLSCSLSHTHTYTHAYKAYSTSCQPPSGCNTHRNTHCKTHTHSHSLAHATREDANVAFISDMTLIYV